MSDTTLKVFTVILGAVIAVVILVSLYFYNQQQQECDKAEGVLARNGFGYSCVQPVR